MVISGFLYHLGYLDFIPAYLALVFGDLLGDLFWYAVGHFGARPFLRRHGKFFSITPEIFEKIENKFHNHQNKIILISKVTMGFGFALATLTIAGAVRVPFKNFVLMNLLGGLVWTAVLMIVGYFFGQLYNSIEQKFQIAFIVFLVVLLGGLFFGLGRYMRQRFLTNKL